MTSAVLSITSVGKTILKVVAGCNGYNIEDLVTTIRELHLEPSIDVIYDVAVANGVGCKDCLVVMDRERIRYEGDNNLGPLYRSTFDLPEFNPRWAEGTADYVITVDR